MRTRVIIFLLAFLSGFTSFAQNGESVKGTIYEQNDQGQNFPIIGANVFWLGTSEGVSTDVNGNFEIVGNTSTTQLVVSFVGFRNDTISATGNEPISVVLKQGVEIDAVEIGARKKSTEYSYVKTLKVEQIGEEELLKGACCNLSESFETSPSVDVSFTDAITGARQIQMLGLAGRYTQITGEYMPEIRGLASIFGLTFIPGTWIEGIQLNKGTGTVVNGFESIAGQINVELQKPWGCDESLILNFYGSEGGRMEGNAIYNQKLKRKWYSGLLLHGNYSPFSHDRNHDGFLDHPNSQSFIGMNRWRHEGNNGFRTQITAKYTYVEKEGGQDIFHHEGHEHNHADADIWGLYMRTDRADIWAKMAKVYKDMPWKSVGSQYKFVYHDQVMDFGRQTSLATQYSYYTNLLYQSIIGNTNHSFQTGVSFQGDVYKESLDSLNFDRNEWVPGAYFEYTYKRFDEFSLVLGVRGDYHNHYGLFTTPKVHMRYAPTENLVFRLGGGKGQRTANVIFENMGVLASSRDIVIHGDGSDKPFGLEMEKAWNFGGSVTRTFTWGFREGGVSVDFYRTDFQNQVVVDLDRSTREAHFYNLDGRSYSNSFQVQGDYELIKRLDVRLAYRWFDVNTTYSGKLMQTPLLAAHRMFINLAYETKKWWKFDATLNWQGEKRVPQTLDNPVEYQVSQTSPSFFRLNGQISKTWREKFDVYVGVENALDYVQEDPIIASEDPFGDYFDSSLIWGPVFGRNIYGGIRYRLKK